MILGLTKKKIFYIIVILLFIINLFTAFFIFSDIQIISAPKTEVFIEVAEVNSDEIILNTTLKMSNSNSFGIGIKDFSIISMNYDDIELGRMEISGGNIPSDDSRVFTTTGRIVLKDSSNLTIIKNRILGNINVNLLGIISKSIPIDMVVITSIEEIFNSIDIPDVDIAANLQDINEDGLNIGVKISVFNPTDLNFDVSDLFLDIHTEDDVSAGNITITGGIIEPKKRCNFYTNGTVFFQAFDAGKIILDLKGVVGAKVGGICKNISFSTDASLLIPDIKEFVFEGKPIDFKIPVQFKLTLRGILSNIGFSIYNPSNVSLIGDNLKCFLYRQDAGDLYLLGQDTMEICLIHPDERVCVKTQILIPYLKYFLSYPYRFLPDWFILRIEGDFFIAGTNQSIPLSLNAQVDPNIFTQKEFN